MNDASVSEIETSDAPVSKIKLRFNPFTLHGIIDAPPSLFIFITVCDLPIIGKAMSNRCKKIIIRIRGLNNLRYFAKPNLSALLLQALAIVKGSEGIKLITNSLL